MSDERTEELGLAARLLISMGGQTVRLRTLNLEESEDWQAKAAAATAGFDIPETNDPGTIFTAFAQAPSAAMLDLVLAYDIDSVLGGREQLRKRMNQRELYAAVKQMVRAEAPFVQDARSVVEAFGPQIRAVVATLLATTVDRSRLASSTNGRSPIGDSTPPLSELVSPRKGS